MTKLSVVPVSTMKDLKALAAKLQEARSILDTAIDDMVTGLDTAYSEMDGMVDLAEGEDEVDQDHVDELKEARDLLDEYRGETENMTVEDAPDYEFYGKRDYLK